MTQTLRAALVFIFTQQKHLRILTVDDGLNMAEELRTVMRWEAGKLGAVSLGVLKQVAARLDILYKAKEVERDNCRICNGRRKISDGYEDLTCPHCA